jgi:DNA-binding CsgD family transcriptional regulator
MGRLSTSDLRGVFGFLDATVLGTPTDPIPRPTLIALRHLVGADEAEYFELRRRDRAVLGVSTSDEFVDAPGTDEALAVVGHQNPLNWRRWHPAHGALRLSAVIRRQELLRLEFHDAFMRPNRLRDTLKVWLWSSDDSAACVQLWRRDTDFGPREQDILEVLQHHLIDLRHRSRTGALPVITEATLTVREAEVLTWAARGESDAAIGARLGLSPATVGKHLEHAYAALAVHSRAEAVGRFLAAESEGGPAG